MKITLLMATTLDGKIGRNSSHLVDWTGKEDKQLFIKLTKDAGAVIMGSNTFGTLNSHLPERKNIVMTKNKSRIKGVIANDDLVFTDSSPKFILKALEAQGFKSAVLIGGSQINSLFLKEKLINEIYLTIVPKFFGTGLSIFSEEVDETLDLISMHQIPDGHILLKYKIKTDPY